MIAMNSSHPCNDQLLLGYVHVASLSSVPVGWLGDVMLGLSKMQLSQVVSTFAGGCVVD